MKFGTSITVSSLLLAFCFITFSGNTAKADERVFAGWILHMFISGQLKEYTPRGGMSECLKVKRQGFRTPIGQRTYDREPIGSGIEQGTAAESGKG